MNASRRKPHRGFACENRFDPEAFFSPAIDYSPVYTWMWNGKVTEEETDRELDEMVRLGVKRFYILPMPRSFRPTSFPTPMEPDYLSEEYFDAYAYAVNGAAKRGMKVWLYDDGGWPSGGACGQVVLTDPSLVSERIKTRERTVRAGEVYSPEEDVEAAFLGEKRVRAGDKISADGILTEYRRERTSFPAVNSADLPDITKKGTTELFLRLTFDGYARKLGKHFGKAVTALFTDEPTAPRPFPYNDEIKSLFKETFREEIEDYLPALTGRAPLSEETAEIKRKFYDILSDLYCKRFLAPMKKRANEASLALVGHLDKDDEANGSMTGGSFGLLRALRGFDLPGVDAIRRQIFPPKGKQGLYGENKFFPRLASSAATQTGGRHALSESFAVYGVGLSYDEMRYVLNFQAMRGINLFNFMVIPYARKGYAQAGLLPHFTENNYPTLAAFNLYTERLSYLFSLGERVAKAALYYPIADGVANDDFKEVGEEYEAIGKKLEESRVPFDLIDDDFLSFAEIEGNTFAAGSARYETVILPSCKRLSESSLSKLRLFLRAGGKVLTDSTDLKKELLQAESFNGAKIPSPLPFEGAEGVTLAQSHTADGDLYFLMNEGGETVDFPLPEKETLSYLLSLADGRIRLAEKGAKITLCPGEITAIFYTDRSLPAEKSHPYLYEIPLLYFDLRPLDRLVIGEESRRIKEDAPYRPAPLGDLREILGEGFSGTVEYKTTFDMLSEAKYAAFDLGKAVGAAEAILDGDSLGVRLAPPYRFELPHPLSKGKHTLLLRLTNTPANEYERTDLFDNYRPWQLGNYYEEERRFHRDSLESGIFGEVILLRG